MDPDPRDKLNADPDPKHCYQTSPPLPKDRRDLIQLYQYPHTAAIDCKLSYVYTIFVLKLPVKICLDLKVYVLLKQGDTSS
jgi:hypothetical protein